MYDAEKREICTVPSRPFFVTYFYWTMEGMPLPRIQFLLANVFVVFALVIM